MAPNSPKEETQQTPSPNQSSTQESQAAPQEAKAKPKAKPKAKVEPGVTQDNDQHYTIRQYPPCQKHSQSNNSQHQQQHQSQLNNQPKLQKNLDCLLASTNLKRSQRKVISNFKRNQVQKILKSLIQNQNKKEKRLLKLLVQQIFMVNTQVASLMKLVLITKA